MAKTHYETLGVARNARANEVKAAYRKLVLKHHPDKNPDPSATQIFRSVTEAFEVLGDAAARKRYDESLAYQEKKVREREEAARQDEERRQNRLREQVYAAQRGSGMDSEIPVGSPRVTQTFTAKDIAEMVKRLAILFSRQRVADSEALARQIVTLDPRQPLPYAVLGDIARSRGSLADAMKMYSFALQMDPSNSIFLRRYEEILDRIHIEEGRGQRVKIEPEEKRLFAVLAVAVVTLLACIYVVLSPERPVLSELPAISTWTIGLIVMLFCAGASAGAALSIGNLIDRVDAFSNGRMPPTLLYGLVSIISFPLAAAAYCGLGLLQKAFSITTTRTMTAVGGITLCLALAGAASSARVDFFQVLVWGGNLVYLGAMGGWTLADHFRG